MRLGGPRRPTLSDGDKAALRRIHADLSNNGTNNGWRKLLANEFRISEQHLSCVVNRRDVPRETSGAA
ncbi:MAG: hypothetical protein LW865_15750 [Betaproteobacteria bacterium]|jgi:hypothetical protein|nr:hypothetical protein [Betaproteobacteria bacterium]